jgi:hypothetical protein
MALHPNDRVDIVAGSYEGGRGTYLAPAGLRGMSARVCVDDDSRDYRTLRLVSLRAIVPSPPSLPRSLPASRVATTGRRPVSPEVGQTVDSLDDLVAEARHIKRRVRDLVLRLEAVTVSGRASYRP